MAIGATKLTAKVAVLDSVSYDGNPTWKAGGTALDLSLFAAVSGSDYVSNEGITVPIGDKCIKMGQVICRVTAAQTITVTVSGTPTGGTFTYQLVDPTTQNVTTVALAYNAGVPAHQAAIDAAIGANKLTVSGSGALPGNVHTLTTGSQAKGVAFPAPTLISNDLTGGTNPTVAFAVATNANSGMYGPYDNTASDGRQTLTQGRCFIVPSLIVVKNVFGSGLPGPDLTSVGVIEGGKVWAKRVIANDSAGSLAGGPLWSDLVAAMPGISPVGY